MNKADVKLVCEAPGNEHLQWWAMVLFAEIMEAAEVAEHQEDWPFFLTIAKAKVREFPQLIIQHVKEQVAESLSLEERVKALEEKVQQLGGCRGVSR